MRLRFHEWACGFDGYKNVKIYKQSKLSNLCHKVVLNIRVIVTSIVQNFGVNNIF